MNRSINIQRKEREAIEFIRKFAPREGYFLAFSGGKDSLVCYSLCKKSGVKFFAYHVVVDLESSVVNEYIAKNFKDVVFLKSKTNFFDDILRKGPPRIRRRWCCDTLKKNPAKEIPLVHRIVGIRASESSMRKMQSRISRECGNILYKPVFDWDDTDIWMYIFLNNLPYLKLYEQGFKRVGCVIYLLQSLKTQVS